MIILQLYGLLLEFIGVSFIIYETIRGEEYQVTGTEVEGHPKYYDILRNEKGTRLIPTKFPKQWKRLILWLFIILIGLLNQALGIIL